MQNYFKLFREPHLAFSVIYTGVISLLFFDDYLGNFKIPIIMFIIMGTIAVIIRFMITISQLNIQISAMCDNERAVIEACSLKNISTIVVTENIAKNHPEVLGIIFVLYSKNILKTPDSRLPTVIFHIDEDFLWLTSSFSYKLISRKNKNRKYMKRLNEISQILFPDL